jgi:transcriptional regulator with XRE-family HTH domain
VTDLGVTEQLEKGVLERETAQVQAAFPFLVSDRARRRIEAGKQNQSQLARDLDLTPGHVCLIFSRKRTPSLSVAAALASRMRVRIDDLYAYLTLSQPQTLQ